MDPAWDFYFCELEECAASIALDMSLLAESADPNRPWLICVRLHMQDPRDDGMSSSEEFAALQQIEDALSAALDSHCAARQVGRLTTAGTREFFFYAAADDDLLGVIEGAFSGSGYEVMYRSEHDPEWAHYYGFIAPSRLAYQWIMDRRLVENLRSSGDDLTVQRPVDHYLFFPDSAQREAFTAALEGNDFTLDAGAQSDDGTWPLHMVRPDPVELDHIHNMVCDLIELADAHGGDYDGWGAPVIKAH